MHIREDFVISICITVPIFLEKQFSNLFSDQKTKPRDSVRFFVVCGSAFMRSFVVVLS